MDSDILVSDQALQQIVSTLENEALGIQGAYLIKMTSDEGFEHRSFRVVSRAEPRENYLQIYSFAARRPDSRASRGRGFHSCASERSGSLSRARLCGSDGNSTGAYK